MIHVLHMGIKPVILKHSQLWAPRLCFFMAVEAHGTLQTTSPVFYTAQETYLSKKNTAVVILASLCSHPGWEQWGGRNGLKIRFDQSPLKSQSSDGISIQHGSSPATPGCRKDFFKNQLLEPFSADLPKISSPLMLTY